MPKKPRNISARTAKARRQARISASRSRAKIEKNEGTIASAFTASVAAGAFRMVCPDGQVRDVTLERMRTHMQADITKDGLEPFGDHETFLHYLGVDLHFETFWLRTDGLWQSEEDYFTDRGEA